MSTDFHNVAHFVPNLFLGQVKRDHAGLFCRIHLCRELNAVCNLSILKHRINIVSRLYFSAKHRLGKRILNAANNSTAKRSRTIHRIKSFFGKRCNHLIAEADLYSDIGNALFNLREHDAGDLSDILIGQLVEDDRLVHAVNELRFERVL